MQSWPVGTGHPCIGCSEKGIGFTKPIHALADLENQRPPAGYPRIVEEQGTGVSTAAVAVLSAVVGAAIGAGAMLTKKLEQAGAEGPAAMKIWRNPSGVAPMTVNRREFLREGLGGAAAAAACATAGRQPRRGAGKQDRAGKRHRPALRLDALHRLQGLHVGVQERPTSCRWTTLSATGLWDTPFELSGKTYTVIKAYQDGTADHQGPGQGRLRPHQAAMPALHRSLLRLGLPGQAMTKDP